MAKRRRAKESTGFHGQAPSDPVKRYEWAMANGQELSAFLSGKTRSGLLPTRDFFPKGSVGSFLRNRGAGRSLKEVYEYYSRRDKA